jgi:hypothetical protein
MKDSAFRALKLPSFAAGVAVLFMNACSTPSAKRAGPPYVRKVEFSGAPQIRALAERARQTGDQMYPGVCALLADGNWDFPSHFDICFKKRLPRMRSGEARMTQICLNNQYLQQFKENPATLDEMVVHEMAHVAQHYYRPIIGRWVVLTPRPPFCWQEGIADYVCFKLGQTNGWRCAECDSVYPHYRNGYSCAGAFLLYLEGTYSSNIVRQLNTALRQGRYSDDFFLNTTGKDLAALWSEFQHTPAFTPSAVRMLKLQQALGFADGKPPKDIERRLKLFLDQHTDTATWPMIKRAYIPGLATGDIQTRLAIVGYFTQPGGTAETFLVSLQQKQELPGFAKGQHGSITGIVGPRDVNIVFPAVRSFTAKKQGDPSTYHYTVSRPTEVSTWKLVRAWRTDAEGRIVEEYCVQ